MTAPIWIAPEHADDSLTVHLGYGRSRAGQVGSNVGFNAFAIRTSHEPWSATGVAIRKTGQRYPLACTQHHHLIDGRDILRSANLAEFRAGPHPTSQPEPSPSL